MGTLHKLSSPSEVIALAGEHGGWVAWFVGRLVLSPAGNHLRAVLRHENDARARASPR
jgi:hypothetical protein